MGDPTTFEDIDEPGDGFIDNPDFCGTDTGGESELTLGERTSPLAAQGIRFRAIRSVPLRAPGGGSSTPRSIPAVARRVVEPAVPLTGPGVRIAKGGLSVVAARRSTWRSVIKREWFELADAEEFLDVETLTSTTARTGSAPRGARRQEHGQSFWNAHDEHLIDLHPGAVPRGEEVQSFAGAPTFFGTELYPKRLWHLGIVPYCYSPKVSNWGKDELAQKVYRAVQAAIRDINKRLGPALTFVRMPADEVPANPKGYVRAQGPFIYVTIGSLNGQSLNDLDTSRLFDLDPEYKGPIIIYMNPKGGGLKATAVHELGHAIGLPHLSQREDNKRWYRVLTSQADPALRATAAPGTPELSVPGFFGDQEPKGNIPLIDSVDYLSRMTYDRIKIGNKRYLLQDLTGQFIRVWAEARQDPGFSKGDVSRLQQMYHHMRHPGWSLFRSLALPASADAASEVLPLSPLLAPRVTVAQSPAICTGLDGTLILTVGSDRRLYCRWIEPADEREWRPVADAVISPCGMAADAEGLIHAAFWKDGEAAPRWATLRPGADPEWILMLDSPSLRAALKTRAPLLATNADGLVECAIVRNEQGSASHVHAVLQRPGAPWEGSAAQFNGSLASAESHIGAAGRRKVVVVQRLDDTSPQVEVLVGSSFANLRLTSQSQSRQLWPGAIPIAMPIGRGQIHGNEIVCASRAYGLGRDDEGDFPILWRRRRLDDWEPLGGLPDTRYAPSACARYPFDGHPNGGHLIFVERQVFGANGQVLLPGALWICTYD
jgi:hypothetical protein